MAMGIWLPGGGGADWDAVTASAGDVLAGKSHSRPRWGTAHRNHAGAGKLEALFGAGRRGVGYDSRRTSQWQWKGDSKSNAAQTSGTATAPTIFFPENSLGEWIRSDRQYGEPRQLRRDRKQPWKRYIRPKNVGESTRRLLQRKCTGIRNWADIRCMAGLTPDKIKKNVSIMGITGTFEGFIPGPYDVYNRGSWGIGYGTKSISGSSPTFELSNIFISSKASSGFMIFISKQGFDIVMQPYRTINIVFDSDLGAFPQMSML